jgi:signal transduction histidine kinase
MWMLSAAVASSATRRVVLLFDERPELPGLAAFDAEFVDKFASGSAEHVEVFREAMDLSRFSSDAHKVLLRDYLRKKYADKQINVTLAIRQPALDFLLDSVDPVFPGAAIVFLGVDSTYLDGRSLPPGVSGVLLTRKFAPTLELALRLHPMTENVVVVSGGAEIDIKLLESARKQFQPYDGRVSFRYLTALPMQELLKELSRLPPRTIVLHTTFFRDGTGQAFVPHDVVERVSKAASVPVYGFIDQYVGRGLVGGDVYSFAAHGAQAAMLALQVLGGSTSSGMVVAGRSMVLFDWRQLQRWNISESRLPPGSEILFREPSVWEIYRWQLVTIAAVMLVQAALILWLLWEHRRRRRLEVEGRQRMTELAHMNRFSTAGEMAASIAHEINQPLGAILNNVETAKIMLMSQAPDLKEMHEIVNDIGRDNGRATDVIGRLRSFMRKVPVERQSFDLNDHVAETLKFMSPEAKSRETILRSHLNGAPLRINGDPIQLQQVLSNLILNGFDATSETTQAEKAVTVATMRHGRFAEISIADTGPGVSEDAAKRIFDPFYSTKEHGMGMGLSIVRTIVEAHNGQIEVESRNGAPGAVFRVRLPLAA